MEREREREKKRKRKKKLGALHSELSPSDIDTEVFQRIERHKSTNFCGEKKSHMNSDEGSL